MQYRLNVSQIEIEKFLNLKCSKNSITVSNICSYSRPLQNSLLFIKNNKMPVEHLKGCIIFCPKDYDLNQGENILLRVENPKFIFSKVISNFAQRKLKQGFISDDVEIGQGCVIGDQVSIGAGTKILNNVVIAPGVTIGSECYIKSGAVIGEEGFGMVFNNSSMPERVLHLGSVFIGDHVEIGANCTIASGSIDDTRIESFVKIDDQVHVAHNCVIHRGAIITAGVIFSGGVEVGSRAWIGPNSTIIQRTKIGEKALIGIGGIVTTDVNSSQTVMGISSMPLRALSKALKKILD
ncbi:UDP-3-O-(3-hydroxymyristoyl)glucosamine N-acyltransferase [Polynucleobacter difficilis]|uniref:UDP-3-O-(3-hydroxymyristoyl)glucosamine N-acyltransferase n=1 Tax=Polynucleobacter difficilis TaxID=556054 RepID=UPI000D37761C|nr:UDP-3-O-(3-hydroxymyristoyl)glucosamine N-acyltransferase [Polynucleobacter difficilis]